MGTRACPTRGPTRLHHIRPNTARSMGRAITGSGSRRPSTHTGAPSCGRREPATPPASVDRLGPGDLSASGATGARCSKNPMNGWRRVQLGPQAWRSAKRRNTHLSSSRARSEPRAHSVPKRASGPRLERTGSVSLDVGYCGAVEASPGLSVWAARYASRTSTPVCTYRALTRCDPRTRPFSCPYRSQMTMRTAMTNITRRITENPRARLQRVPLILHLLVWLWW